MYTIVTTALDGASPPGRTAVCELLEKLQEPVTYLQLLFQPISSRISQVRGQYRAALVKSGQDCRQKNTNGSIGEPPVDLHAPASPNGQRGLLCSLRGSAQCLLYVVTPGAVTVHTATNRSHRKALSGHSRRCVHFLTALDLWCHRNVVCRSWSWL